MVSSIVDTVPSPVNPLTDTVSHQVIPQFITNTLPTTELEMNTCAAYGAIKYERLVYIKLLFQYNIHQ